MKIIIINNLYNPYKRGGTEVVVEAAVQAFEKEGHEVKVIATRPYFSNPKNPNTIFIKSLFHNLEKIPFALRLFWHWWDMVDFLTAGRVKRILKKEQPDLVITHNLQGLSLLIPRVIQKSKIKNIYTLHDIQLLHPSGLMYFGREGLIETFHAKVYQKICAFLVACPDVVIAPSKWLLDLYSEKGFFKNSKKQVIKNPIEFDGDNSLKELETDGKKFVFLYIGQIEEHKGVGILSEAFSLIMNDYPNAKLKFIGDGTGLLSYQEKFKDIDNICFLGRKSREEVKETLENSNCLVVPSTCYENSPSVVYESALIGRAVIASRIGGITELVREFGGILITPGDKEDLKQKLIYALDNPLEIKQIGEQAKSNFSYISKQEYVKRLREMV